MTLPVLNSPDAATRKPLFPIMLAALGAFGAAIAVAAYVVYAYARLAQCADWPATEALITRSEVISKRSGVKNTYQHAVEYDYEVQGQKYKGTEVNLEDSGSQHRWLAESILKQYEPGTRHAVYYDPKNPERTLLNRSLSTKEYCLAGVSIFWLCVGVGIILYSKRKSKDEKRAEKGQAWVRPNK